MSIVIEQRGGAAGAPNKRRLIVVGFLVLALAVVAGAAAWRTLDQSGRDATSLVTETAGVPEWDVAPLHSTVADSGRLTVYLVGSDVEAANAYERIAAAEAFRAQNWAPPLNASVVVAGSPDDERRIQAWYAAMNDGLGVPVDVIDLRAAAG